MVGCTLNLKDTKIPISMTSEQYHEVGWGRALSCLPRALWLSISYTSRHPQLDTGCTESLLPSRPCHFTWNTLGMASYILVYINWKSAVKDENDQSLSHDPTKLVRNEHRRVETTQNGSQSSSTKGTLKRNKSNLPRTGPGFGHAKSHV